jgi:predicted N-acetyltransferase YhbS
VIRVRNPENPEDLEKVSRLTAQFLGRGDSEGTYTLLRRAFAECPFLTPDLCLLAEVDGEIAASGQALPLEMQVGNTVVQAGGVQAIVVDPRFRSRHLVERLFHEGRAMLINRGLDFSLGFGHPRYYDRLGATPIAGDTMIHVRTRDVRGTFAGGFRGLGPGDVELLLRHYAKANAGRTCVIRRSLDYWTWLRKKPSHVRIREDGYVGYELREKEVLVSEINGEGPGFYRDALGEVAGIARSEGLEEIMVEAPPDHPFVDSILSFGVEVCTTYRRTGWCMGEILDVTSFFGKLEGELTSRLRQTLPASPDVDLVIRVDDQTAELALPGTKGGRLSIELTLPRKPLTQLAVGYKGLDTVLHETGVAIDAERRQVLRAILPKGNPFVWMPDRF